MTYFERILCPTDFGADARTALGQALRLAVAHDARVDLVHAVDVPRYRAREMVGNLAGEGARPLLEIALAESNAQMDGLLGALTLAERQRVSTHCLVGSPAAAIVEHAQARRIDLIVLGASGKARFSNYVLGGVAVKTIRHAPCPVLCVPSAEEKRSFRTMLVGTDFSECSMHALRVAASVAMHEEAKIVVAYAMPTAWSLPSGLSAGLADGRNWLELLQREAREQLDEFVDKARTLGVEVSDKQLLMGSPAQALLHYAKSHNVDLIAVGAHGRTAMSRLMLGSVTETIVHNAEVPVLTVRGPGASSTESKGTP